MPVVKVPAPSVTLPPAAPPPANEPIVSFVPLRSSVAPATFASVTAEVSAMAAPPATCNVPALIVVAPVYVLAPESVKMPVPALVSPPVPLITPEKAVDVLLPPVVSVPVPSVTLPTPAREPIVSAKLFRSKTVPPATTTALVLAMRFAAPNCKVPTLIVVAPVYVLLPERVRVPAPFFMSPPVPLMTPLIANAPALFRESDPVPSATFPATVEAVVDCNEIVPAVVVSACAVIPPGLNG